MAGSTITSTTPLEAHQVVGGEGAGPKHVAVIMDGNGRWANARGEKRVAGHKAGVEALRDTVENCRTLGIEHLTVFSFSTENWRRPPAEIEALFGLLRLYVHRDLGRLNKEGVRIRIFGSVEGLSDDIVRLIHECEAKTRSNTKFNLNIAFNYGGRAEIVEAAKHIASEVQAGVLEPDSVDEAVLHNRMWTSDLPDVDLLIRTSGEMRVSNFLLWSIAYSELIFMDVLWPDFGRAEMEQAIDVFKRRNRRFGGVESDVSDG